MAGRGCPKFAQIVKSPSVTETGNGKMGKEREKREEMLEKYPSSHAANKSTFLQVPQYNIRDSTPSYWEFYQ